MEYILTHCGAKLIFVDHEYSQLVADAKARIILCNDTGRAGDPYEDFLTAGRAYSHEKGWPGLEMDSDENQPLSLNYTYVLLDDHQCFRHASDTPKLGHHWPCEPPWTVSPAVILTF